MTTDLSKDLQAAVAPRQRNSPPIILIVEDEEEIRNVFKSFLESAGYTVLEAASGAACLQAARARPPDLVISDVLLPGMDGYEIVRRLHGEPRLCGIPIILISGLFNDRAAIELARGFGVRHFLTKPIPKEVLLKEVSDALRETPAQTFAWTEQLEREHNHVLVDKLTEKVKALETSEERFRGLVAIAPVLFVFLSSKLRILEFNSEAERLSGRKRSDVLGRDFLELFVPPAEHHVAIAHLERSFACEPTRGLECRLLREDGPERFIVWNLSRGPGRLGQSDGIVAVGVDVTERKLVEQETRARARQQRALAELGQRTITHGTLEDFLNGAVLSVSSVLETEFCKVLQLLPDKHSLKLVAGTGWGEGEVGRAVVDTGPETQAGYTLQCDRPVIVEDLRTETRFRGPALLVDHGVVSGVSVTIDGATDPWGVLGVHTLNKRTFSQDDVLFVQSVAHLLGTAIARQMAERDLRENERDLRLFALATNDAFWKWDFATGRVDRSVGFEKNFGYPAGLIQPHIQWWLDLVHSDDLPNVMATFHKAVEDGAGHCEYRYRFRLRDGAYATVEDRVCIVRDIMGQAVRVLGAMTDITRQLALHEAVARNLHRLLVAEEDERRRIAKELHDSTGQDLVAAMMNLEFIREKKAGLTSAEIGRIEDSLGLLDNCAHEIRTLSYSLHPPRLDEAGLVEAIRHYVTGFGQRTGLKISLELADDFVRLQDTTELILFRVLQEGLGNIRRHSQSRTARVRLRRESGDVVLQIADDGVGIPSEVLAQGENLAGLDMGVGLPGIRERLRQIEGRLEIESSPGGTILRAVVPLKNHLS